MFRPALVLALVLKLFRERVSSGPLVGKECRDEADKLTKPKYARPYFCEVLKPMFPAADVQSLETRAVDVRLIITSFQNVSPAKDNPKYPIAELADVVAMVGGYVGELRRAIES
jgi:hypothetical protein